MARNVPVPTYLPFNVNNHPDASSAIAQATLSRLESHVRIFSEAHEKMLLPTISCVQAVLASGAAVSKPDVHAAMDALKSLAAGLDKVRGAFGVLVWDVTRAAAASTTCAGAAGTLEAASSAVSARASSLPSLGALTGQPMALSALTF